MYIPTIYTLHKLVIVYHIVYVIAVHVYITVKSLSHLTILNVQALCISVSCALSSTDDHWSHQLYGALGHAPPLPSWILRMYTDWQFLLTYNSS